PPASPPGAGGARAACRGGGLPGRRPASGQRGLPRLDHARGPTHLRDRRARAPPRPGPAGGARGIRGGPPGGRARAGMNLELTDEERLIQETAREFTDREIVPRARDNDRAGRFDRDLAHKLGEMGYLGAPVAAEYGGRELAYVTYGLIVEQIGRGDSSARTVVSVQTSLVCGSIERWGSEGQKRAWLPRLGSGGALGCFALTV